MFFFKFYFSPDNNQQSDSFFYFGYNIDRSPIFMLSDSIVNRGSAFKQWHKSFKKYPEIFKTI